MPKQQEILAKYSHLTGIISYFCKKIKCFIQYMLTVEIIDDDLRELIIEGNNRKGKYKELARDKKFVKKLTDIYNTMRTVEHVSKLKEYSFLHYERLKHISKSSVRIFNNRVERLLFIETEDGIQISLIEIDKNHYGNKK